MSLELVFKKHISAFFRGLDNLGRTSFILHKIDIAVHGPIRYGMRRIQHEQITVLKGDKLQKAEASELSISPLR